MYGVCPFARQADLATAVVVAAMGLHVGSSATRMVTASTRTRGKANADDKGRVVACPARSSTLGSYPSATDAPCSACSGVNPSNSSWSTSPLWLNPIIPTYDCADSTASAIQSTPPGSVSTASVAASVE